MLSLVHTRCFNSLMVFCGIICLPNSAKPSHCQCPALVTVHVGNRSPARRVYHQHWTGLSNVSVECTVDSDGVCHPDTDTCHFSSN